MRKKRQKCSLSILSTTLYKDLSQYITDPELYSHLSSRTPYSELSVRDDYDRRQLAAYALLTSFDKKHIGSQKDATAAENAAINLFLATNQKCRAQNALITDGSDAWLECVLNGAFQFIQEQFFRVLDRDDSPLDFLVGGKTLVPVRDFSTGPGITSVPFVGLAVTKCLPLKYGDLGFVSSPLGAARLRFLERYWQTYPFKDVVCGAGCDIKTVPKRQDIRRIIIPQLNGDLLLQYPACSFIEKMIASGSGIILRTQQSINRKRACEGSKYDNHDVALSPLKNRGPRWCTIDLSSASDLIGTELVKRLLPMPLFDYLSSCRPTRGILPSGEIVELNMMGNMGNAYCFPLQMLVFYSLVREAYKAHGLKCNASVYGDDIIVDYSVYDTVIKLLRRLLMEPNVKKSFSTGFFRESCGGDYYMGYDIRPVFFEDLDETASLYSLINGYVEWGAKHSLNLRLTLEYLTSCIPENRRSVIPFDFNSSHGLKVTEESLPFVAPSWRKNLQVIVTSRRDAKHVSTTYKVGSTALHPKRSYVAYSQISMFHVLRSRNNSLQLLFMKQKNRGKGTKQTPRLVYSASADELKQVREYPCVPYWDALVLEGLDATVSAETQISLVRDYLFRNLEATSVFPSVETLRGV